jgi:hypothetical protein
MPRRSRTDARHGARSLAFAVILAAVHGCGDKESPAEPTEPASPPFPGTIQISPDILTGSDPTTYLGLEYAGQDTRRVFDRREGWVDIDAFLFDVEFENGLGYEARVNPEFGDAEAAQEQVEKYSKVIGRLPTVLLSGVETIVIHEGDYAFGGRAGNILIHTGRAANREAGGFLEEVFIHEGVHATLDAEHATAPGWLAAQEADGRFLSQYGQDHPEREDLATTFGPWMAVRYREDRISSGLADTIRATIPNRLEYLDAQDFDMYPVD